jgi:hypothetical protein
MAGKLEKKSNDINNIFPERIAPILSSRTKTNCFLVPACPHWQQPSASAV